MAINMTFTDFVTPVPADWLNNVNFVVNNPTGVSYLAPYTGAVSRTVAAKFSDTVSVLDFGADKTGTLDSTSAMQAAHNTGKLVYYPGGSYKFGQITIATGGIVGDGQSATTLISTDLTSADLITFTGSGAQTPALFRDFTLSSSLSKTLGAGIRFNTGASILSFPYVNNVQFLNLPTGIYFSTVQQFVIDACVFVNYSQQGIHIENTIVSDAGDSCISNCFFNTAVVTGATYAIWHRSAGGLKITNSKILGGNSGYVMGWIGGNGAADLSITGCSIEDTTAFGIFLGRDTGTGSIGSVMIVGNEIGCPNGISTDTSGFILLMTITGNVFNIKGTTTAFSGISLNNIGHFSIGPNILNGAQGGGTPQGINIASNCSNGKIAAQTYVGFTGTNALIQGSSTTYLIGTLQTGVASITASTAYPPLFTGSVVVTFPAPYLFTPTVTCAPSGTGGGQISVFPTNITTTGFTMVGISVTSGGSMPNNIWTASGIL